MGKQPFKKKKKEKHAVCSFPSSLLNMAVGMKACSQKENISETLPLSSHRKILFQEKSEFSNLLPLQKTKRHGQLYQIFQGSYRIKVKTKDYSEKIVL